MTVQGQLYSGSLGTQMVGPAPLTGNGPPPASFKGQLGQLWFDNSQTPPEEYTFNGQTWQAGGGNLATNTTPGSVYLATLAQLEAGNAPSSEYVPSSNDVATVIAGIVVGAVPPAKTSQQGIVFLATNAEAAAGLLTTNYAINPGSLAFALSNAAALPIGNTTAGSGAFTTLAASGNATLGGTLGVTGATTLAAMTATTGSFSSTLGVTGASTLAALAATTGTFSSTLGVTGLTTLAALTQTGGTANINATGTAGTNIGNPTGTLTLEGATIAIDGTTSTIAIGPSLTSGVIAIGGTGQTGATSITLGQSTATNSILIQNGINTAAVITSINNATSASGTSTVNILSGATPAASQTLNVMNGIASSGTQLIDVLGGANTTGSQTFRVFHGNIAGATDTIELFGGTISSTSTCAINMFSGASTAATAISINALNNNSMTKLGTINLATGTGAAHVVNIGSNAGGNVTIIGGSTSTIGIGLGGDVAQTITIGAVAGTGTISIGTSTASETVNLMDGVCANGNTQTLNIASASTVAGTQVVNLLNGATPASTSALTLNVMAGLPAGASTNACNFFGGAYAHGTENFNVFNGAIAAGSAATMNLFAGTIAGGTNTFNLFTGNSAGGTLAVNIFGDAAATTGGTIKIGTGAAAHAITIGSTSGTLNLNATASVGITGNLNFVTSGNKILSANVGTTLAAGANSFGSVSLVGGTIVVSTSAVTTNSLIFLTCQALGTVAVASGLAVTARTNGVSFTITASQGTDTSSIAWFIVN